MPETTAFGAYLYQLRILSGKERISEYLKDFLIPFSDNYYRDVEAGRKTLSIDAAVQLHHSMKLEGQKSFDYFWHYFRDSLPDAIHEMLFGKRPSVAKNNLDDLNKIRDYDTTVHRKALAISRYEREFIAGEKIIGLFNTHFEYLPLMHYLYMVEVASESDFVRICRGLDLAFNQNARDFLSAISEVTFSGSEQIYKRLMPVLRTPRNEAGLALKDRFLLHEIARSIRKQESSEYFSSEATFRYSSMTTIRNRSLEDIQNRIVDLLSAVEVESKSSKQLDEADAHPYFFSIIISGRDEYDGRVR